MGLDSDLAVCYVGYRAFRSREAHGTGTSAALCLALGTANTAGTATTTGTAIVTGNPLRHAHPYARFPA